MTVFHPAKWLPNWPTGALPYASIELCRAHHPELADSEIVKSPYVGPDSGVQWEVPAATSPEGALVSEPAAEEAPAPSPVSVPTPKSKSNSKKK